MYTETYRLLFIDSFIANLAINFTSETVLYAIKIFATIDRLNAIVISSLACFCSNSINYCLGSLVFKLLDHKVFSEKQKKLIQERKDLFLKYKYIFLLCSIVPAYGKFAIVSAGYTGFPFIRTMALCLVFQSIYYLYMMYI
jgi:membrane protein YqaA with SNARE-associated domain